MTTKRKTSTSTHASTPKRSTSAGSRKPKREILFPTEPSTIGLDKIKAAVHAVIEERRRKERLRRG